MKFARQKRKYYLMSLLERQILCDLKIQKKISSGPLRIQNVLFGKGSDNFE